MRRRVAKKETISKRKRALKEVKDTGVEKSARKLINEGGVGAGALGKATNVTKAVVGAIKRAATPKVLSMAKKSGKKRLTKAESAARNKKRIQKQRAKAEKFEGKENLERLDKIKKIKNVKKRDKALYKEVSRVQNEINKAKTAEKIKQAKLRKRLETDYRRASAKRIIKRNIRDQLQWGRGHSQREQGGATVAAGDALYEGGKKTYKAYKDAGGYEGIKKSSDDYYKNVNKKQKRKRALKGKKK